MKTLFPIRQFLCLTVLLLLSSVLPAADDAAMQRCMAIADSLKRLDCFEKLARSGSPGETAPSRAANEDQPRDTTVERKVRVVPPPAVANEPRMRQLVAGDSRIERWLVKVSADPVRGGARVVLRNKARKGRNQYAVPVEIRLECNRGKPSAQVLWREPIVRGEVPALLFDGRDVGEPTVAWLMDAKRESWIYTGDFNRLVEALESHAEAGATVEVMEENINFEDDVIRAEFDLTGARLALEPLRKACF